MNEARHLSNQTFSLKLNLF